MSHYVVLCFPNQINSEGILNGLKTVPPLPPNAPFEQRAAHARVRGPVKDVRAVLESMLAKYSEHIEVEPYQEECYCVGSCIRRRVKERVDARFGEGHIDALRRQHAAWAKERGLDDLDASFGDDGEAYWKELLAPRTQLEEQIEAELRERPVAEYAGANGGGERCEECNDTGFRETSYNPDSKWDWYQVGGRWTGMIDPDGFDPRDDPDNMLKCFCCSGRGKLPMTSSVVAMWAGGEAMLASDDAPPERRERLERVKSWQVAAEAGPVDPVAMLTDLYPDRVAWLRDDGANIECWVCHGSGFKQAWPTEYKPHPGDVQEVRTLKALMQRQEAPQKHVPYAALVELADGSTTWYARGEMGWFGCSRDAQSKDGWVSDFRDLVSSLPDDGAVIVVDCHI